MSQEQMGVRRTALTLARVNQPNGFDCPGCAWPDPEHTATSEFCENGAKAVAEEATLDGSTPTSSPSIRVERAGGQVRLLAGQQGRLTEPMLQPTGARPLRADRLGRGLRG